MHTLSEQQIASYYALVFLAAMLSWIAAMPAWLLMKKAPGLRRLGPGWRLLATNLVGAAAVCYAVTAIVASTSPDAPTTTREILGGLPKFAAAFAGGPLGWFYLLALPAGAIAAVGIVELKLREEDRERQAAR